MFTYARPKYSTNKKGKKVFDGHQRPKMPNRSPVLTKKENDELHSFLRRDWDSMSLVEKDWNSAELMDLEPIKIYLDTTMKHRWGVLDRYNTATTRRLEFLRKLTNIKDLKKAAVTKEQLDSVDSSEMSNNFIHLLEIISSTKSFVKMVESRFGKCISSDNAARQIYKAFLMGSENYLRKVIGDEKSEELPNFDLDRTESIILNMNRLGSKLVPLRKQIAKLSENSSTFWKFCGNAKHILGLFKNLYPVCKKLSEVTDEELIIADDYVKAMFNSNLDDFMDMVNFRDIVYRILSSPVQKMSFEEFIKISDAGPRRVANTDLDFLKGW